MNVMSRSFVHKRYSDLAGSIEINIKTSQKEGDMSGLSPSNNHPVMNSRYIVSAQTEIR